MAALTKSTVRALGCETHYVAYYHNAESRKLLRVLDSSPVATIGIQFHEYRRAYVAHLADLGRWRDEDWARELINSRDYSSEARALMLVDVNRFMFDSESFHEAELRLGVNERFEPTTHDVENGPRRSTDYAEGVLDLLFFPTPKTALIMDTKTGYGTEVDEFQAEMYSLLVMMHFPDVEGVTFKFEMVRHGSSIDRQFLRCDVPFLQAKVRDEVKRRDAVIARVAAGETLRANPFQGLCSNCHAACPLKDVTGIEVTPVRSQEDAIELARRLKANEDFVWAARKALKGYLTKNGSVELTPTMSLMLMASSSESFVLPKVLEVLGLQAVNATGLRRLRRLLSEGSEPYDLVNALIESSDDSPEFRVPISSLKVASTELGSFASAKSREGLRERLDTIAVKRPDQRLKFGAPPKVTA